MLISSARLYVHKNVKINAYICIMYILVWPHNGVKSFLEEHSYFSEAIKVRWQESGTISNLFVTSKNETTNSPVNSLKSFSDPY